MLLETFPGALSFTYGISECHPKGLNFENLTVMVQFRREGHE